MTHEEIIKLFPLKAKVSYWDILFANRMDESSCIGARTLRKALKKKGIKPEYITWGVGKGAFFYKNSGFQVISRVDMMDVNLLSKRKAIFNLFTYDKSNYVSCDNYQPHKHKGKIDGRSWREVVNKSYVLKDEEED